MAAPDSFPALAALDLTHAAQGWELPQSWSREGAFPALRELRLEGITLAGQLPRNEVGCLLMQSKCIRADCCLVESDACRAPSSSCPVEDSALCFPQGHCIKSVVRRSVLAAMQTVLQLWRSISGIWSPKPRDTPPCLCNIDVRVALPQVEVSCRLCRPLHGR